MKTNYEKDLSIKLKPVQFNKKTEKNNSKSS